MAWLKGPPTVFPCLGFLPHIKIQSGIVFIMNKKEYELYFPGLVLWIPIPRIKGESNDKEKKVTIKKTDEKKGNQSYARI
jgi:hypothetical protein